MNSRQQKQAMIMLVNLLEAIDELTQEAGYAISGHLYAALQGIMSLEQYQDCLRALRESDLITVESNHTIKSTEYAHNLLQQRKESKHETIN